jgi:hypothetical protein
MNFRLLFLLAAFSLSASAQNWSSFLDPSRAIDWTSGVGFTIPTYSTACATQPTLQTGSSNASANATAIQNALASCDATHNVVNIPAGTYYVAAFSFGSQGKQVLRGAGPKSTYIYLTGEVSMISGSPIYNGNPAALPPSGTQQCLWTGGYAQGTTTITLSSCGGTPPVNRMLILDQANDTTDTNGVYICDTTAANCTYKGQGAGNQDGRIIGGVTYSEQQVTYVTGVTNNGNGTHSVTISPGVYATNIRSSQSPGAWWSSIVQNDGLENLTLDGTNSSNDMVQMYDCYQCWEKNIRSINGARAHVLLQQSAQDVIRDSYFYQSQSHSSVSYCVESEESSGFLVENNIFQQITNPLMFGQGSGAVIGYNLSIDNIYTTPTDFAQTSYYSHNAGNIMNLWEGNNMYGIWADDAWGSSAQGTFFRDTLLGWQSGKTQPLFPVSLHSFNRAFNYVGNILGQPGIQNQYQAYATSSTGGVGAPNASTSIYELGWSDTDGLGTCTTPPTCDSLVYSTLMRWGNYDTVNAATQWNSTEASPGAVTYVNANFTSSYFSTLAQTLPASLYYKSTPAWWPAGKAWPPVGPDVSSGNLGTCSGTYTGAQATSSSQCTGGTLSIGWASYATSIPAQDCYLTVMGGPPDGSGSVLSFDANTCYNGSSGIQPASPLGLTATVVNTGG